MTERVDRNRGRWASRAVQALFLIALISLWAFATTLGHVSPILLPNPLAVLSELIDVLKSGEFVGDLRVTLTELATAFAISLSGNVDRADDLVQETLIAVHRLQVDTHQRMRILQRDFNPIGGWNA